MTASETEATPYAVVLNRDLMFGAGIRNALESQEMAAKFARDTTAFIELLESQPASPALGIVDMNGPVDWERLGAALGRLNGAVPTIGFGSHTDVETRRAAKAAGLTRIVSNGEFHRDMGSFIARYRAR